jgi:hypothetical protein
VLAAYAKIRAFSQLLREEFNLFPVVFGKLCLYTKCRICP